MSKQKRRRFENMESVLDGAQGRRATHRRNVQLEHKVEALEAKLVKKDGVIAEISEEFVELEKELGEF